MPYNGSGVHTRVHDWTTDLANTVPVTASRMDAEHDDISTALSTAICRDGQSTTSARIPFAQGLSAFAGTTSSVSYAQNNDNNTGLYFPGSDQWGLVAGGTAVLTGTATGVSVTGTFSASGAATFSSTLGVTGNFAVNTDKFTVAAATGNTAVGGTLAVTGAATFSAAVTCSTTLAVTGIATFSSTSHFVAPSGTTAQRPSAAAGQVRYNTTTNALEYYNGTAWASPGRLPTQQILTSGSGATYTTPTGARQLRIRMVGGGGGGRSGGANNGTDGSASSFNSISAAGGSAATGTTTGGTGGTGGSGSANRRVAGQTGGVQTSTTNGTVPGGNGGASMLGFGGMGLANPGAAAPANSGGGGAGGAITNSASGPGGGGGEYVELIIDNPSGSYTYTVGGGGTGGSGTGNAGGNGGSGVIIVDEYY